MMLADNKARTLARGGLCRVMQLHQETGGRISPEDSQVLWEDGLFTKRGFEGMSGGEWYRTMLFSDGAEVFASKPAIGSEKFLVRKGFKRKDVEAVLARGGKLTFGESLRCRIRYLTDGMVFGTRGFVDEVFKGSRDHFSEKRTSGARSMRGIGWKEKSKRLYSMRDLKKEVLR